MKKLSDYEGNEAIELYGDLLKPASAIFTDEEIKNLRKNKNSTMLDMASLMLKNHSNEISEILLRIDPTPLNGANIIARLISMLTDIGRVEGIQDFFPSAEQKETT